MEQDYHEQALSVVLPDGFSGSVKWQSPSNIALVKYWGKKGKQLPQNPSISFTLSDCRTETSVVFCKSGRFNMKFRFEGRENALFAAKIENFLLENLRFFPFLDQLELLVASRNTFPHSSGIASSASSMSALVMCLLDMERLAKGCGEIDLQKASYFSRLASGSAARSVLPKMALWGMTNAFPGSSDEYAVSLEHEIHPCFSTFHDSILIVSDAQKSVSSRAGHALMIDNPYAKARYHQANENVANLLQALKTGDLDAFVSITESEALQLHALMMCSNPSYILMKPNTLNLIQAIRQFRKETKIPVCFTLDAGPNVHLLYPDSEAGSVRQFIKERLERYCAGSQWIDDTVGEGSSRI